MGRFLNKGNSDFEEIRNFEYVDKSTMIQCINSTLKTEFRFSCVTRGRRFGKSMAAKMLYAYYDKSCNSRRLFEDLAIAKLPSFEEHLNKYPTIFVDMTEFTTDYKKNPDIVKIIQQTIKKEICTIYPEIEIEESYNLMDTLFEVADKTKERFVFIIDEWDAICREFDNMPEVMDEYVDLLRRMFKGGSTSQVFVGVYMTGILPIKRYNTQSALNNFCEYSMIMPGELSESFGFTHDEVKALCKKYTMDLDEMERWYDGYTIGKTSQIFNPFSVMRAIKSKSFASYWQNTSAYDNISTYIQMNYEGLKDDVIKMLAGESVDVTTTRFQNDLHIVRSKDDVLTVLIHLGYLSYDEETKTCRIPNKEVADEFMNAVLDTSWNEVIQVLDNSKRLIEATINCDETAVAYAVNLAHDENTSILTYNNENSLACVLAIAYIYARNEYIIHREYASGKGFADLVLIPRRNVSKPAIVIELKYNTAVNTAIDQIRQKNYPEKVRKYTDNLLLVGICYDRKEKRHKCKIERLPLPLNPSLPPC